MSYISLHCHSDASNIRLLDSINKTDKLIDYAYEVGLSGLALTDHDVLSNHIKALKHVAKRKKENPNDERWQNFKLILGNEIYLTRSGLTKDNFVSGEDRFYHFILLAKDEIGHKQLRELSSRAWKQSFYRFLERVPTYYSDIDEVIGKNPGHVMGSTACLGGWLPTMLMEAYKQDKHKQYEAHLETMGRIDNFLKWAIDVFGKENFFLEKQPSLNKEQWIVNSMMEDLSQQYGLKCIITTDAHYLRKEDRPIHKAYLNAKQGDREVDEFYASTYVMSGEEILEYFVKAEELFGPHGSREPIQDVVARDLANTISCVGAQVKDYDLAHSPIIPRTKIDWSDITPHTPFTMNGKSWEYIDKFATSESEQDRFFISRVMSALVRKYDPLYMENRLEEYYDRINTECKELWNISEKLGQRLSSYLLLISEIIRIIWDEGDSLVGPGRGSSSGFLTNYLLDIVQVDPLQAEVELPHWRSKLIGLPLWRHNENNFVNARKSGVKLA